MGTIYELAGFNTNYGFQINNKNNVYIRICGCPYFAYFNCITNFKHSSILGVLSTHLEDVAELMCLCMSPALNGPVIQHFNVVHTIIRDNTNIRFLSKTGCHIHTIYVRTNIEILMKMISLKSLKSLQYEIATVLILWLVIAWFVCRIIFVQTLFGSF